MWLNTKRSTVTIGLIAALVVALGLICYLVVFRKPQEKPIVVHPPHRPVQGPPQGSPQGAQMRPPTVVLFYANWCGHCKQLMPAWKQASQTLQQEGIQVIEKEHGEAKDEIQAQGIKGFPALRLYPQGYPSPNFSEYQGDRTTESIINFVHSGGQ